MAQARPSHDLVACVVAWHNRHPLARRITAAQVVSVGLVSFPFQAPGRSRPESEPIAAAEPGDDAAAPAPGGSLRERASARARAAAASHDAGAAASAEGKQAGTVEPAAPQRKGWRAAFSENLLDPISPRQVARWALRHGSERRPGPPEAPVREIDATGPGASAPLVRLWVFTAAIDCGAQRVRVFVAPFDARRVIGPRIIGRGRVQAASAGAAALGAGAAAWVLVWGGAAQRPLAPVVAPMPMAAASASSAAPSAAVPPAVPPASAPAVAQPTPPSESHAGHVAAADPSPPPLAVAASAPGVAHGGAAAATEAPAPPTPPTAPSPAADGRPHLAPFLSDEARLAAREASEAARAERARRSAHGQGGPEATAAHAPDTAPSTHAGPSGPASPSAVPPATAAPPSRTRASTTPAPPAATAWAVSTRRLRTRFESEQMLAALRDVAYREGRGSEFKLEVLPAGEDWQAVGWPLATRAEAERLRDALAARGLKADVVPF